MNDNYRVSAGIIGDLLTEGPDGWPAGVCEVINDERTIKVYGESGHIVGVVEAEEYKREAILFDAGENVIDLETVAKKVNELIEHEHAQL